MSLRTRISNPNLRPAAGFALRYLCGTIVCFVLFDSFSGFVRSVYVKPLAGTASFFLHLGGIESSVISNPGLGSCDLWFGVASYRITQACSGLFTCALYLSAILAYPVGSRKKAVGLLIGIPAFFTFGVLRVVIMAVVAVDWPSRVEIFHVYIMAIANLGFALFVWLYWFDRVVGRETAS